VVYVYMCIYVCGVCVCVVCVIFFPLMHTTGAFVVRAKGQARKAVEISQF